jgi:glutamate synthase domain-containing protein 1
MIMCGIVGLHIKNRALRPMLGKWLLPMFECMANRGADSAGLAVFREPVTGSRRRFNLFAPNRQYDWLGLKQGLNSQFGQDGEIEGVENHATVVAPIDPLEFRAWLAEYDSSLHLLSVGRSMDIYKDTGHACETARRYGFERLNASHCVGHTRMATESAVTPYHSHPFTAGEDFCLVHNGSLSNPHSLRRRLEKLGVEFETDNDTEAACRFLEWRMRSGDELEAALQAAFAELDGFYTLLMATTDRLVLVRDAFACKPAVAAEHDDYVAISSEFRSLAHLPDIQNARIFEPHPEEIYAWKV